jgi:class 3 adenylate cyclase
MTTTAVLNTRIQRFRYGAYLWLALELGLFARIAVPPEPVWGSVPVVLAIPWLLGLAQRRCRRSLQGIENVTTPLLIAWLSLPLLCTAAVIGALLVGCVAQSGWRTLARSALQAAGGWCSGALLAPSIHYPAEGLADALCVVFIVLYTLPLCALGYEETMRMHRQRERAKAGSAAAERARDSLARYVASPVAARVCEAGPGKAPLTRRWLTVAFVDIIDFTALTERLAPEDLTTLLDDFFAGLVALALTHGGNLHKFLGDGALISFGDARSGGRRPDARACVAMLHRLAALIESLNGAARDRGIPATLGVRAGVASGFCSVGDFGAGQRLEYTMIGAAVNLASRLEALAAPGETWAAQATRDLVGESCFEALGSVVVKGVAAPVPAYRLRVTHAVDGKRVAI